MLCHHIDRWAWTCRHLGVGYDAFKGHATNANATAWCRRFGMQLSFGASIMKFGEGVATQLADAWRHKMQAYVDALEASSSDAWIDEAPNHVHRPTPCIEALWCQHHDEIKLRINQLRAIRPSTCASGHATWMPSFIVLQPAQVTCVGRQCTR